jgi:hypothetical protein
MTTPKREIISKSRYEVTREEVTAALRSVGWPVPEGASIEVRGLEVIFNWETRAPVVVLSPPPRRAPWLPPTPPPPSEFIAFAPLPEHPAPSGTGPADDIPF